MGNLFSKKNFNMKFAALIALALAKDEPADCNFGKDAPVECEDATTCCSKATGVDLSGAIGEKLGDATLTEDNVKEMEEGMMAIMEGFAEAGEGGCLPLNSNTYTEDGATVTYECGDGRTMSLDEALEELDGALDQPVPPPTASPTTSLTQMPKPNASSMPVRTAKTRTKSQLRKKMPAFPTPPPRPSLPVPSHSLPPLPSCEQISIHRPYRNLGSGQLTDL